jgi:argininosuccinate lyase
MAGSKRSSASKKSWQGRLTADADAVTAALLASIDVDWQLGQYDIAGSIAHAQMLREIGVLTAGELKKIREGLLSIAADLRAGKLPLSVELEDIHMVIEKALIERIGEAGKKLHTGRSRNDQVALDLRLWARATIDQLTADIRTFQRALVDLAKRQGDIVMPAYTHLQRAQPVLAGHAVLAYVEMLERDAQRLADARKRVNVSPLGSGAVAGTSLPLNRQRTAELLDFDAVSGNSIDATSDRDFLAELCFDCAMLAVHLSRWAEDWILYSTTEFGFLQLADAYCTSSSMMPQKKNPDTLELIRGKSATALANLTGMLTLLKGLPLAYNRDLQDDKRFAFATAAAMRQSLAVAAGIASTAKFSAAKVAAGLDAGFLDATALAEYLVGRGVPFRQAHHVVGQIVAWAEEKALTLSQIELGQYQEFCSKIGADVHEYLGAANVVRRYSPAGAGGARQLRQQLATWAKRLAK